MQDDPDQVGLLEMMSKKISSLEAFDIEKGLSYSGRNAASCGRTKDCCNTFDTEGAYCFHCYTCDNEAIVCTGFACECDDCKQKYCDDCVKECNQCDEFICKDCESECSKLLSIASARQSSDMHA